MRDRCSIVVTCEHATNRIPARYRSQFAGRGRLLRSHRGYDPGALALARDLARLCGAPLLAAGASRLLVDLNRSPRHPRLFSGITRALDPAERERILEEHYRPHRMRVEEAVSLRLRGPGRVVHLAVHTFTPRLRGTTRRIDVGFLYDPARRPEAEFCARWLARLARLDPKLRLRRNAPYRGVQDGLVTALRRGRPASRYLGIEIEVSQRFPRGDPRAWRRLRRRIAESLLGIGAAGRAFGPGAFGGE